MLQQHFAVRQFGLHHDGVVHGLREAPYLLDMRVRLAQALEILPERVNVKATTEERLGFTGREEGIAAHCVALLLEPEDSP